MNSTLLYRFILALFYYLFGLLPNEVNNNMNTVCVSPIPGHQPCQLEMHEWSLDLLLGVCPAGELPMLCLFVHLACHWASRQRWCSWLRLDAEIGQANKHLNALSETVSVVKKNGIS